MSTIRIWTFGYRPFVMGGNTQYIVATDLPCPRAIALGKGFFGFRITAPNGCKLLVESTTGGIVGNSLQSVRNDIKNSNRDFIMAQLAGVRALMAKMDWVVVKPKEFWSRYPTPKTQNHEHRSHKNQKNERRKPARTSRVACR